MTRKKTVIALLGAALLGTALLTILFRVGFNITGHFEGLYLLHEKGKDHFEVTDHLFVGKGEHVVYGTNLKTDWFKFFAALLPKHSEHEAHLHLDWSPKDGSGYVSNQLPDGTSLVTYFGRYLDGDKEVHGLFVGGGLPDTVVTNVNYNMNNSGMTFYNGKTWYHIWCSVNEGIDFAEPAPALTPSRWKFLGSRVVSRSNDHVVIESSHEVKEGASLARIDRRASFTAGEPYFSLEIRISNISEAPVHYHYTYGDEPWVGYYGTALGDVGWVKDRLITHEESIDSARYSYAGMADLGNRAIGERPVYTNLANFIEWLGDDRPHVYFSNDTDTPENHPTKAPLESNERFIGLVWDKALPPGSSQTIRLNIGMAYFNPKSGIPEKPPTTWK
jgi:hypothetical protein